MKIENLSISYGNLKVFENFNIEFKEGKITAVLGRSGIGKTTLLKHVANLLNDKNNGFKPSVSFVFQTPCLVENLSVKSNILLVQGCENKVENGLEKVGLKDKINAKCKDLSLGEKQRVNLLRAFTFDSDVTLLDEPFSALDLKTKNSAHELFCSLFKNKKTAIIVTHDIEEALAVADEIVVIKEDKTVSYITLPECAGLRNGLGLDEFRKKLLEILLY